MSPMRPVREDDSTKGVIVGCCCSADNRGYFVFGSAEMLYPKREAPSGNVMAVKPRFSFAYHSREVNPSLTAYFVNSAMV